MEETFPYQFKQKFLVSSADVDFQQELRFSSLTNYLIQIAWRHAEQLKWGVDDLHKHNLVWVLMGVKIQLVQTPKWRETITIETWPKGINRLFYLRDFKIYNSNQQIIGRATSNWLLIDIEKRRPKLHHLDSKVFEKNFNNHAIEELIPFLKAEIKTDQILEYIVRYSDVDLNHHLTTTRYIDWIFDTHSLAELKHRKPKELTVNFSKEIIYGQTINMHRSKIEENTEQFQLVSEDGNTIFFRAELRY